MIKITNAQLWVHDQDEALAFYTEKVGMEVRADVTVPELGNFRWLTVSPPGQTDVAIVLMAIPGPPVMDAETAEQVVEGTRRRVRRGARRAALRNRLGFPRPVGQQLPSHPGARTGGGLGIRFSRSGAGRAGAGRVSD